MSGLTTTKINQPGQVITKKDGAALYLTTETTAGEASNSAATTNQRGNLHLGTRDIELPRGFAVDFGSWLNSVLSLVMVISALLVFFYLISAAFDWIMSGGDKGATEKARSKMTAAVIGLIIVAASYAILNLIVRFLGFNNLNDVLDSARTIRG
ncbi:MAG TPA: hypothetical protein VD999_02375 [Vitreimonas sp.]|nr:hypothetical protein [Vitreimonas sp.]